MKVSELLDVLSIFDEDLEFDNTFNVVEYNGICLIEPLFKDENISNKSFKEILQNMNRDLDIYVSLEEFENTGYPQLVSVRLNSDEQLTLIDEFYN